MSNLLNTLDFAGMNLLIGSIIQNNIGVATVQTGVTASVTQTQAGATLFTSLFAAVSTVATIANAVRIPTMSVGQFAIISNEATNSMQLYGTGAQLINAAVATTGVAVAGGKTALLFCFSATDIRMVLSA